MRREFAKKLYDAMEKDTRIFLITADLGYGVLDDIRRDFPKRAINIGSSEMLMVGIAVGLAQSGYIPLCYSITPFLLYRPFELIRNYMNYEKANVKLVGSGRDDDYAHDGISHWAGDDMRVMSSLKNIKLYKPRDITDKVFTDFMYNDKPSYINLSR
jgi:transketolase|tara:strand:- start:1261 stop:1731 length:471 start_codon:yes stop_codon:yes gene_type:complete